MPSSNDQGALTYSSEEIGLPFLEVALIYVSRANSRSYGPECGADPCDASRWSGDAGCSGARGAQTMGNAFEQVPITLTSMQQASVQAFPGAIRGIEA